MRSPDDIYSPIYVSDRENMQAYPFDTQMICNKPTIALYTSRLHLTTIASQIPYWKSGKYKFNVSPSHITNTDLMSFCRGTL